MPLHVTLLSSVFEKLSSAAKLRPSHSNKYPYSKKPIRPVGIACIAGWRFLRGRECFARESAMLKLEKRGENGASQKERGRGWGEREKRKRLHETL